MAVAAAAEEVAAAAADHRHLVEYKVAVHLEAAHLAQEVVHPAPQADPPEHQVAAEVRAVQMEVHQDRLDQREAVHLEVVVAAEVADYLREVVVAV